MRTTAARPGAPLRSRTIGLLAMAAAGVLTMTACTAGPSPATEQRDDTIVWAVGADAVALDPQNAGQEVSQRILALIYEPLLTREDGVELSPGLAASYTEVSPTMYDVALRDGARFSNGREVTVDDVVGSFERLRNPELGSYMTPRLSGLVSVTALDESTVRFELAAPSSDFLELLADPAAAIMPIDEIEAGELVPARETLGTGPYVVESYQKDNGWTLTANEHYWNPDLPEVPRLEIQILADEGTLLAALRGGSADIVSLSNSDSVPLVEAIPDAESILQQNPNYYVLALNSVNAPALADVAVRQAVNLAIDRATLNDIALGGTSEVVGPIPQCPADGLEFSQPDPERAVDLLASTTAPAALTLSYDGTGGQEIAAIAQAIQAQLAEVGLTVTLEPLPLAQLVERLMAGELEMSLGFYTSGTSPYLGLGNWEPSVSGFTGAFNAPVPAITESLPVIATTTGDVQAEAIRTACEAIDADSAQIPLLSRPSLIAWRADRIEADLLDRENGAFPLRRIASYSER